MYSKLKSFVAGGIAAISLVLAAPASAAFVGAYQLSNFTLSAPGGGSVDISGAPNAFVLIGSNNGSGDVAVTVFSILAQAAGAVNFSFNYLTNDVFGGIRNSAQDPAGYVLNGIFTQLSEDVVVDDTAPPIQQAGSNSFAVNAGDIFGFYVQSLDSNFGAASLSISAFDAPIAAVPEPGSFALLGLGLAGIALMRRRKSS